MKKWSYEINTDGVTIDFSKMSQLEIDILCSSLNSVIRDMLKDPEIRAEYEEWRETPEGRKAREGSKANGTICNV